MLPCLPQFDKGWIIENTGSKRWKDVSLVHEEGFLPLETEVAVPGLAPGEQAEVVVSYRSLTPDDGALIHSSWRLYHKGIPFGCRLWLSVVPQAGTVV